MPLTVFARPRAFRHLTTATLIAVVAALGGGVRAEEVGGLPSGDNPPGKPPAGAPSPQVPSPDAVGAEPADASPGLFEQGAPPATAPAAPAAAPPAPEPFRLNGYVYGDGFAEARVRYGLQGDGQQGTVLDLREAYVNLYAGPFSLRLGQQMVVWG